MKVILTNGIEVTPIMVTGASKYVQGATRDCLTFVFAETSLDELDALFTEVNCETLILIGDDESENIHSGYVIKTEILKKNVVIQEAANDAPEITEIRCFVTMGQRTYSETQIAAIAEEVTNTQLALCEIYESM